MNQNTVLTIVRRLCRLICHQIPERCFCYKGYLFPICARCTGIIITFTISLILLSIQVFISLPLSVFMLSIMCVDWSLQFFKIKESTNKRRFATGLIGGLGLSYTSYYVINFFVNYVL